jgi:2',3'-cyclic-nucleotide 2'-phosphodiesterase/3'-nucleotidase
VAEVARLYPYENTLRAVRVTGAQLRAFLEQSARYFRPYDGGGGGAAARRSTRRCRASTSTWWPAPTTRSTCRARRAAGDAAARARPPGGRRDTFTLALNNYRQTGGGGFAMLAGAPVVYDRGEEIRELLMEEVRRRGTLRPQDYHTVNWRLEPAGAVARAYAAGQRGAGARPGAPPPARPTGAAGTSGAAGGATLVPAAPDAPRASGVPGGAVLPAVRCCHAACACSPSTTSTARSSRAPTRRASCAAAPGRSPRRWRGRAASARPRRA